MLEAVERRPKKKEDDEKWRFCNRQNSTVF